MESGIGIRVIVVLLWGVCNLALVVALVGALVGRWLGVGWGVGWSVFVRV